MQLGLSVADLVRGGSSLFSRAAWQKVRRPADSRGFVLTLEQCVYKSYPAQQVNAQPVHA